MKITIQTTQEVEVRFLAAACRVRYWEDSTINGQPDKTGTLVPCRRGECWSPVIDLETGIVQGWPLGTTANLYYKLCDEGTYSLLDEEKNVIKTIEGYAPEIMCPEGGGYGDYVIMKIDANGKIAGWKLRLDEFTAVDN